jgi:hypothetical protein
VSVLLEQREELQGKGFILSVSALVAMLLEYAHDKNIGEMERLFGDFIDGVALYEQHVFVAELHMRTMFEKGRWRVGQRPVWYVSAKSFQMSQRSKCGVLFHVLA